LDRGFAGAWKVRRSKGLGAAIASGTRRRRAAGEGFMIIGSAAFPATKEIAVSGWRKGYPGRSPFSSTLFAPRVQPLQRWSILFR
jgi:hypothetical protein